MDLEKTIIANAFALATAIVWVLCAAFVYLFPGFSLLVSRWWMHGLDISIMGSWNLTLTNFILGGLSLTVCAWIAGYIYGWSWERLSK